MTNNLWIPHVGDKCPVAPDTVVEVMFAEGIKSDFSCNAERWAWGLITRGSSTIVLYRIVEQPKADWETFFEKHGADMVKQYAGQAFTINELWEAFEARLKAEGRG